MKTEVNLPNNVLDWVEYWASQYKEKWLKQNDDEAVLFYEQGMLFCEQEKSNLYNPNKAAKFFLMASNIGYIPAMYELSILVLYGIIEKEQLEAYEYTLKAIEVNYPPACYVLGKFYEQGIVVESNIEKACECYLASAELGYSISQYALGRIYDQIFKQSKTAEYWYLKSIVNGYFHACYDLGYMYWEGRGKGVPYFEEYETINRNYYTAAQLFRRGVSENISSCYYPLGLCYQYGHGVEEDIETAIMLYQKGVEENDMEACCHLAELYADGIKGLLDPNIYEAIHLFEKGAELGDESCMTNLGYLYLEGSVYLTETTDIIDKEKAIYWFKKAAELGDETAEAKLEELC